MGLIDINKRIEKALQAGRLRPDLLKELSEESPADTAKYAYLLASIPYPELRRRFLKLNAILFLLLLLLPCLILMAAWPIDLQEPTLFFSIKVAVPLLLSYFVYHFHGGVYRLLCVWCGIDLLESLLLLEFTTGYELGKITLLVLIIGISLFLAKKVFPNLKFLGPRQDSEGRYLL